MSDSKDPVDEFMRSRQTGEASSLTESLDASNIDDMLDALDRVLSSEETFVNVDTDEPAPIVETVRAILEELLAACDRLESAAHQEDDHLVAGFAQSLRARTCLLIKIAEEVPGPAAGPIEIELDYAGLHEFMLFPDLTRIAS